MPSRNIPGSCASLHSAAFALDLSVQRKAVRRGLPSNIGDTLRCSLVTPCDFAELALDNSVVYDCSLWPGKTTGYNRGISLWKRSPQTYAFWEFASLAFHWLWHLLSFTSIFTSPNRPLLDAGMRWKTRLASVCIVLC